MEPCKLLMQCRTCLRVIPIEGDDEHAIYTVPSDADPEMSTVHVVCRAEPVVVQ
jgi:hypothetical protein